MYPTAMTNLESGAPLMSPASANVLTDPLAGRVRVLIVEDDRVLADAVARVLSLEGFSVYRVESAEQAAVALHFERFDIAIVDIGLPGQDGLQLVQYLRRSGAKLPILMLTARDGHSDRANALAFGANDYMTKPFQVDELRARCRALVRHASGAATAELVFGALKLDLESREAFRDGISIDLTQREWAILECLVLNAGRIVSKERLRTTVRWKEELAANALEEELLRLRGKLGDAVVIRVVRGLGYRLDDH